MAHAGGRRRRLVDRQRGGTQTAGHQVDIRAASTQGDLDDVARALVLRQDGDGEGRRHSAHLMEVLARVANYDTLFEASPSSRSSDVEPLNTQFRGRLPGTAGQIGRASCRERV